MVIDETFKEHILNAIEELLDIEPGQQNYPADVLIDEEREVSLVDFINKIFGTERLGQFNDRGFIINSIDDPLKSTTSMDHPEMLMPYGPAILASLGGYAKKFNLHKHESSAIRLLTAHHETDSKILDFMSYDPCALVRREVYENPDTSEDARWLLEQDPFGVNGEIQISECICRKTEANAAYTDFFDEKGLEIPVITHGFEKQIREYGPWNWATQPFPLPQQDYSLGQTVEYLKTEIPDQYSLNHFGHGINSYSLNFRFAVGNIALFGQVAWGGMHMSEDGQERRWDEFQLRMSHILMDHAVPNTLEFRKRKFLIVYSDFRFEEKIPELHHRDGRGWKRVKEINSWDDVEEYLKVHNV